jgi:hypothetical protein
VYLNVGQSGDGVVAQTTNVLAGVSEIERVAPVGGGEAQLATVIDGGNVLEHGVNRLEDTAVQFLELAQLNGIIDAVVLHVISVEGGLEGSGSGHGVTIHVGQTAITGDVVEVGRSSVKANESVEAGRC